MTELPGHGFTRRSLLAAAAAVPLLGVTACGTSAHKSEQNEDPQAIATDAYVFGFPLVLFDVTRASASVPVNQLTNISNLVTASYHNGGAPNRDTLYSSGWLQVSAEPIVIQVPAMPDGRYWVMQVCDAWSSTVHDPSSVQPQAAGPGPFTYAFTGSGWSGTLPAGITQLPMQTDLMLAFLRIAVNGADDVAAVRELQQQVKIAPLSSWLADPAAAATGSPSTGAAAGGPTTMQQIANMNGRTFFERMCALMTANPPAQADAAAMKRFAKIGITPGGHVDSSISDTVLDAAVKQARTQIPAYVNPAATQDHGWAYDTTLGTYGTNYLLRAMVAWVGLTANLGKDALYLTMKSLDAQDNGAPRRSQLRFPAGQLPPVDAFWSVTAYNADFNFVDNPAQIYAVGHQIPPVPAADGSVTLAIQAADPGPNVPTGNWLPIPETGTFSLILRLYAAQQPALTGGWHPPALEPANS